MPCRAIDMRKRADAIKTKCGKKSLITLTTNSTRIDLFTSRINCQFPLYLSYKSDPHAYAVDALALNSNISKIIAFRLLVTFRLVYKRVKIERSEGLIVVLYWPGQPLQNSQNVKERNDDTKIHCKKHDSSEQYQHKVHNCGYNSKFCIMEKKL